MGDGKNNWTDTFSFQIPGFFWGYMIYMQESNMDQMIVSNVINSTC